MQNNHRAFLYLGFLLALGVLSSCGGSEQELTTEAAPRPNILFFLVDDMGTQDICQPFLFDESGRPILTSNNEIYRTPNIEGLARNGRLFTNAYAYSVCSPTRVSLLTGLAAARHRVTTWTHPKSHTIDTGKVNSKGLSGPVWNTRGVPADTPLLTRALKNRGYRTLFAGKAHFGPNDTPNGDPKNLGFDVNIGGHGAGGPGSYWGEKNFSAAWRKGGRLWDVPHLEKYHGTDTFLTEALTLEMGAAIEQAVKDEKPFFAYMSHYAVHAPFESDARFAGNYPGLEGKALAFATLIEGMDRSLGDLIKKLEDLGVAEETLIVFYSDNGSDGPLKSKPLRGKKGTRFEGGLRVPLIASWARPDPDNAVQKQLPIPPGSVEDAIVACTDMMPTLLEIAGAGLPEEAVMDGRDIRPYLKGESGVHRPQEFLAHFPHGRHNNTLFSAFRKADWKIIYRYAPKAWELYNLAQDLEESDNAIDEHPQLALQMAQEMIRSLDSQDAQYPLHAESREPVKPDLSALKEKAAKSG